MESHTPIEGAPTARLADFAINTRFEDIPEAVRAVFPDLILDTLGVMLAGTVQPVYRRVAQAVRRTGGPGPYRAISGEPGSLSNTAFLDALAAADFEFEHVMQNTHPASAAFPALLLLAAERSDTGEAFLAALIVAYELAARIGAACGPAVEHERGFHNPGVNGTLAAAAGSARLLGLSAEGCASALGLAGSSAAGLMAFVDTGAMTKRLHPARSAQLGLESAFMAQAWVEGPQTVLESPHGFLHAFSPRPNPSALEDGLGEVWNGAKMIIKLAPTHAYALAFVEALNQARDRGETWSADAITSVTIETGATINAKHMDLEPKTLVAAQYSVPFCIATGLALDLRNPLAFSDDAVADPAVRTLVHKIAFTAGPEGAARLGGKIVVDLGDRTLEIDARRYAGFPGATGYSEAISRKFDRTLAALEIPHHGADLRSAVDRLGDTAGPVRLRRALVAAGEAAQPRWGKAAS